MQHRTAPENHKKTKCHLWKKKYNKKGYCIETSFYDTNRNLRNGSNGYAIAKYDYDSHGNLCEESYVNDNGEPCISKIIGVHKIQKKYDKYGNCTYAKCYNTNNNPCFNKEGYCSQRTKYDDVGNITSVELFDVKDDLIIGYKFVHLGKMMEMIKGGMDANEALEKASGQYGRFDEAVKKIDPREE